MLDLQKVVNKLIYFERFETHVESVDVRPSSTGGGEVGYWGVGCALEEDSIRTKFNL